MARGQLTQAEKEADVVRLFTEDPTRSESEVAEVSGVAKSTVHDIKKRQFGDFGREETIQRIIDKDLKIVDKGQDKIIAKIEAGKGGLGELAKVTEVSSRRHQLLSGGATERVDNRNLNVNVNVDANKLREEFEDKLKNEYLKPEL